VDLDWNAYESTLAMPHMAPGDRLSEVELMKLLGAFQWESIGRALHLPAPDIRDSDGARLYGSVVSVEFRFGAERGLNTFREGSTLHVKNATRFFGKRFAEGFFSLSDEPIACDVRSAEKGARAPGETDGSWAYMTNAFVERDGSNARLRLREVASAPTAVLPMCTDVPRGLEEHRTVQRGGKIQPLHAGAGSVRVQGLPPGRIRYRIIPESDLNGAGLLYFARYHAIMNYAEREYLQALEVSTPNSLVACLCAEHRKSFFFANADAGQWVAVIVGCDLQASSASGMARETRPHALFTFRLDMYRESDGVLMARSLVEKSLRTPTAGGGSLCGADEAAAWLSRLSAALVKD
jgi:probable biosynthetic protein (TIGR04098 family)